MNDTIQMLAKFIIKVVYNKEDTNIVNSSNDNNLLSWKQL